MDKNEATPSPDKPLVVITGAAGRVGATAIQALRDAYALVGLDEAGKKGGIPMIPVDFTADISVETALEQLRESYGGHIASVIHLAGFADFTGEDNPLYRTLNIDGTRRLLDGLQRFRVEQFVFASTMLVERAGKPGETIDEDRPLEPRWAYPQSKAAAEAIVRERRGAIPSVIARFAGLYDDETVVPTLAHQIARIRERDLESHVYAGSLQTQQSMIHHDDLGGALRAMVERRGRLPEETVILLGEPDPPTYQDLQDAIGEALHGNDWATVRVPATLAAAGSWVQAKVLPHVPKALGGKTEPFVRPFMMGSASDNYALDTNRARELLGWQPHRRIVATLPTILHQLKQHPKTWYQTNNVRWTG